MRHAEAGLLPIEELELTLRPYNCLKRDGVDTIGQLATMSEEELSGVRSLGTRGAEEIRSKLAVHGYELRDDSHEAR